MRLLPSWAGWSALLAVAAAPWLALAQEAQEMSDGPADSAAVEAHPGARERRVEECRGERFVVLRAAPELDPALASEVRTDLATELEHRGLSVCGTEVSGREPAARIVLRVAGGDVEARAGAREQRDVVIELDDRVTDKRVERDVSLARIPPNGRALAIAIAIDELLRASWAELTLRREPPEEEPEETGPAHVRREPTEPVSARGAASQPARTRARVPLPVHLGGSLGYAHTADHFDAFSLQARASLRPREVGWFELSVGGLASLPAEGEYGDVLARGFSSTLTLGACSRGPGRMFGCAGARAGLDWLALRGVPADMAHEKRQRALAVSTSFAAQLAASLRRDLYLFGEAVLGALVHGVNANEGTNETRRTVMGVTGMLVALHVGLGFEL